MTEDSMLIPHVASYSMVITHWIWSLCFESKNLTVYITRTSMLIFSLLFTGVFQRSDWSVFIGSCCSEFTKFIYCTRGSICCVCFDRAGMLHASNKRECHTNINYGWKLLKIFKMLFTEHSTFLIQSSNKIMKYLKTNCSKSLICIEISKQI